MTLASPAQTVDRPSGPKGLPLLGLLLRMRKAPLSLLLEASRNYGDVVPMDFGIRQAFLVNHPDLVKLVLQDRRANYPKSMLYEKMRPAFGNGLLLSEGDFWATQRRLIQPAFHHHRLEAMAALMAEESRTHVENLARSAGRPVDVAAEMSALTLSIVVKAMFGAELKQDLGAIAQAVEVLNAHANHRFHALIDWPMAVPTLRNLQARGALARLESIVYGIIRQRRAQPGVQDGQPGTDGGPRGPGDLLSMLLAARYEDGSAMEEKQVRDEVMTIFLAGHETTATSLAWTLYLLDRNPEAEARLREELSALPGDRAPGFADLPRLPYLKMVVEESMRLQPPVWAFSRTPVAPDELGGVRITSDSLVMLSPYAMHRHPRWWDSPEEFRPERFAPGEAEKRPRYAYFPFGGGPRQCIGNAFAMMEAQIILASLLRRLRFRLASGQTAEARPLVTLRPKHGMFMVPTAA